MRFWAFCIVIFHVFDSPGAPADRMTCAPNLQQIRFENRQAAKSGAYSDIQAVDGWLGHIPKSLRMYAVEAAFASGLRDTLYNAGVGKYLPPEKRYQIAYRLVSDDPKAMDRLESFGLSADNAIYLMKLALPRMLDSESEALWLMNRLLNEPNRKVRKDVAMELIQILARKSRFKNEASTGKAISKILAKAEELGLAGQTQREELIVQILGSTTYFPNNELAVISRLWNMGPVRSSVQAAYLKVMGAGVNNHPDQNLRYNLTQADSIWVWTSVRSQGNSVRYDVLRHLKLPKNMEEEIFFGGRPGRVDRDLITAVFLKGDRKLSLRFIRHYGPQMWGWTTQNLPFEESKLRISDLHDHFVEGGIGASEVDHLIKVMPKISASEAMMLYGVLARAGELDPLEMYVEGHNKGEGAMARFALFAKHGIRVDTRVTPEMAKNYLDKSSSPKGAYSVPTAERFLGLLADDADKKKYLLQVAYRNPGVAEDLAVKHGFSPDFHLEILKVRRQDTTNGTSGLNQRHLTDPHPTIAKYALLEMLKSLDYQKSLSLVRSFPREDRVEAALLFIRKFEASVDLHRHLSDLGSFGLTSTRDRLMLAGEIFRLHSGMDPQLVATALDFNGASLDGVLRARFAENITSVLENFVMETEHRQLHPNAPAGELIETLERYAKTHSGILPPGLATSLCGAYRRREVIIPTLTGYYRANSYMPGKRMPTGPEETWSQVLGLPLENVRLGMRSELFGDVVVLALATEQTLREPPYKELKIPSEYYEKKNLKRLATFLGALRDWLRLEGNDREGWRKILGTLERDGKGDFARGAEIAGNAVLHEVRNLFASSDLQITYEKFQDLEKKWKDLSPIITLAARLGPEWEGKYKEQLNGLARIFSAVLEDRFFDYKFSRHREQIPFFESEDKIKEWARIRHRLDLFTPGRSQGAEPLSMEEVLDIVQTNVRPHATGWEAHQPRPDLLDFVRQSKGEPQKTLAAIKARFYAGVADSEFFINLKNDTLATLINTTSQENLKTSVWIFDRFAKQMGISGDLENDFRDLKAKLDRYSVETNGQAFVFTTNVWDAKSLLRIGRMVQAASCMNFMTGGYAYALTSYVEHAGLQGLVTFVAEKSKFQTSADFELVKEAHLAQKISDVKFDPNDQVIEFTLGDRTVRTRPFLDEEATNRHAMKAGGVGAKGSGIMVERAYHVNHVADSVIRRQVTDILSETARDTGSVLTGTMTFYPPNNSVGIYSDAKGGLQTAPYEVNVVDGFQSSKKPDPLRP